MTESEFNYIKNFDKTITITGYNGDDINLVIPSEIDGLAVTSIGYGAFYNCTALKSVTIPDSVKTIGDSAFYTCIGLTSITISDSVKTIGNSAFYTCIGLTSITISDSVTTIGSGAFFGCRGLKTKISNYKAFNLVHNQIECRGYTFNENEWAIPVENIEMCERGYHFCTNLFEVFNYYYGVLDKDIAIYECEVGDKVIKSDTSKCVTNTIKPVRRLFRSDIIKILNGQENEKDAILKQEKDVPISQIAKDCGYPNENEIRNKED